jgi:3D (Asp-Asp-Asp) domain-containing protein
MDNNAKKSLLRLLLLSIFIASCFFIEAPFILGNKKETALAEVMIQILSTNLEEKLPILDGNSLVSLANPAIPDPKVVKKINVIVTAYSSTVQETDESPFFTASGSHVKEGIVANNLLPFGTRIRIPEIYGDKIFVVEDRLNPRVGFYHIDIWFSSHQEAENFGASRTYIEVLDR